MKIAIIGSGIAGLTAAHHLSESNHVTLMERASCIGLDGHGTRVGGSSVGGRVLDVPPRMFNTTLWPELTRLYREIGLAEETVDSSQTFCESTPTHREGEQSSALNNCYFKIGNVARPKPRVTQLFSRNARQIASDTKRLMDQGRHDLADDTLDQLTLDQYLTKNDYSTAFVDKFLYPTLASTVCTCSYDALKNYPATVILLALRDLTSDADLCRVAGGSAAVVDRLSQGIEDIRTDCAVQSVSKLPNGVLVRISGKAPESFDHVVMATQANTAVDLLLDIDQQEKQLLRSIRYEDVDVTVHQDDRLMPSRRSDWSSFNMVSRSDSAAVQATQCTVWMNRFDRRLADEADYFQTIGPIQQANTESVLSSVTLQRPIVDLGTKQTLREIATNLQVPGRRIWYAGSWASYGIPLLESAVVSALQSVRSIEAAQEETLSLFRG